MEAEFDRLDKDKNGELDVNELAQSKLRVSHFVSVGKQRPGSALNKNAVPVTIFDSVGIS
jgi:hypothetical protein